MLKAATMGLNILSSSITGFECLRLINPPAHRVYIIGDGFTSVIGGLVVIDFRANLGLKANSRRRRWGAMVGKK
jgi:hypothetical protein